MKEVTKHYTNGEVTVVWKNALCQHATRCWKGLHEVFDPQKSPWINIQAADTARIIAQVEKCPSGALTYFMNDDNQPQE